MKWISLVRDSFNGIFKSMCHTTKKLISIDAAHSTYESCLDLTLLNKLRASSTEIAQARKYTVIPTIISMRLRLE